MSYGAAVQAMITSLKNNKRTRVNTFERMQKQAHSKGRHIETYSKKKLSKKAKERIQAESKLDRKQELREIMLIVFISVFIFGCVLYFFLK